MNAAKKQPTPPQSLASGINYNLRSRTDFILRFLDGNYDPFAEAYAENLAGLNEVVKACGEPLEGNLIYDHHQVDLSVPSAGYLPKRRTFALMAQMFSNVMEIGFNAGHSALLMLTANPQLRLTCIDICLHSYTLPCYEYLRGIFGDRISLINANSMMAFPLLARQGADFDLYIIDGHHSIEAAETDLFNVIQFGKKGSMILFDDADYPPLRVLLDMYLLTGKIISQADQIGYIKNFHQMFFINNRES